MPTRWSDWVHAIISIRGSWLPGDPRGLRDHGHRIHSSGDYRRPPPAGEHAGLHRFARARARAPLVLPPALRRVVADALAEKLMAQHGTVRILAIGRVPGHMLLKTGNRDAKPLIGRAKQFASHRVRHALPGNIWAQGCHVVRIRNRSHYARVVAYIAQHEDDAAADWIHPDVRNAQVHDAMMRNTDV